MLHDIVCVHDAEIAAGRIPIERLGAVEILQDLLGMGAGAAGLVGEDHAGRIIASSSAIIAGQRPEVTGHGPRAAGIRDRGGDHPLDPWQVLGRIDAFQRGSIA